MGKIETRPKTNVNNVERQNSKNLVTPSPFKGMYANNPANHPGIHVRNTVHNMSSIENWVHAPKSVHIMKETMLVSVSFTDSMHFFEKSK